MTEIFQFFAGDDFIKALILLLSLVSVFLLAFQLIPDAEQLAARRRLGVIENAARTSTQPLLRWFRPLFTLLVPYLPGERLSDFRERSRKRLMQAKLQDEVTPDELFAFKILMTALLPLGMAYSFGAMGSDLFQSTWFAWPILGFLLPDIWLTEKIRERRRNIVRALPYALDLITLSVEAGLDFIAAIKRLTQRTSSNALIDELNQLLREIRLGESRSDALRNLSKRVQIEELTSLVTLLIQADRLGTPVGQVLRAQADQMRSRRFTMAEAAGAKASQLMLFPLVFCIFPSIIIIVVAPGVLNFIAGGFF